jgi:hypothetical protein
MGTAETNDVSTIGVTGTKNTQMEIFGLKKLPLSRSEAVI